MTTTNFTDFPSQAKRAPMQRSDLKNTYVDTWGARGLRGYSYEVLNEIFPWGDKLVFRGGIIGIHDGKLLIIKELDRLIVDDEMGAGDPLRLIKKKSINGRQYAEGLYGFPKGSAKASDKTIFQTAIREFKEEVGVELSLDDLLFPAMVFARENAKEVIILFPVMFKDLPKITVNKNEIAGHEWLTASELLLRDDVISIPTRCIVTQLKRFKEIK